MKSKKTEKTKGSPKKILVSILMGSSSDWEMMENCKQTLDDLGINNEMRVLSAHRTPEALMKYLKSSQGKGTQVFVAAAGMAAHLAGTIAAHTTKPVIGVPLAGPDLEGLDALLSTVQMPAGVPVATVALGKAGAKKCSIPGGADVGPEGSENCKKGL